MQRVETGWGGTRVGSHQAAVPRDKSGFWVTLYLALKLLDKLKLNVNTFILEDLREHRFSFTRRFLAYR